MTEDRLKGLLAEAASRIRDIEEEAHGERRLDVLEMRIEDAAALAQDIEEALS